MEPIICNGKDQMILHGHFWNAVVHFKSGHEVQTQSEKGQKKALKKMD